MIKNLDASMLNLPYGIAELAPLCRKYGIQALRVPEPVLEDDAAAREAAAVMADNGLVWGLLPMPIDFYHWDVSDEAFAQGLKTLAARAEAAEKLGVKHAYNHVWSTAPRAFDENFAWHAERIKAVSTVLNDHGVRYGLEFLGPHELRTWQKYEFVHSLAGVLALADAAGGLAGIAFDTFHWYCSNNACMDDLAWMAAHTDRLVALHLNDAVPGLRYDEQKDMQRRLPMETGLINSRDIFARLNAVPNDALYMIEPFEPGRTLFNAMGAEDAVRTAAEIFARVEGRSAE